MDKIKNLLLPFKNNAPILTAEDYNFNISFFTDLADIEIMGDLVVHTYYLDRQYAYNKYLQNIRKEPDHPNLLKVLDEE